MSTARTTSRSGVEYSSASSEHMRDVDERVGWVARRLDVDHGQPAWRACGGQTVLDGLAAVAGAELDLCDPELGQDVPDEMIGAAVERVAVEEHVAWSKERQECRGDGCHAAGEDRAGLGLVPERQAVFEDLEVRVVDAAVDQAQLPRSGPRSRSP